MQWVLVGAVAIALVAVGLSWLLRSTAGDASGEDATDPLFVAGIAIAGSGAALLTTLLEASIAMFVLGGILMVVGIVRSRRGPHGG